MAAVDLRTGIRLWEVPIGGRSGAWVAGDFIYVTTRNAELVCLTRRGGRVRWIAQLPRFEDEEDQEAPYCGRPVLAGDRLLVGSTQKEIWSISPYTGKILGRIEVSTCADACRGPRNGLRSDRRSGPPHTADKGLHMRPVIAIVGRPNVGKSTLFNRLTAVAPRLSIRRRG